MFCIYLTSKEVKPKSFAPALFDSSLVQRCVRDMRHDRYLGSVQLICSIVKGIHISAHKSTLSHSAGGLSWLFCNRTERGSLRSPSNHFPSLNVSGLTPRITSDCPSRASVLAPGRPDHFTQPLWKRPIAIVTNVLIEFNTSL